MHRKPESAVREQLQRILASQTFSRSERLSGFLRFVVEHTLDGDDAGLKEQTIALELYQRGSDFDAATDAVVRVDARRLRDKLREYYAENPGDLLVITLPKGAYVPAFEHCPPTGATSLPDSQGPIRYWLIAGLAAFAGLFVTFLMLRTRPGDPPKLTPLTSYPGNEAQPALSPDGNFVAFSCSDPHKPDNQTDICVKAVGADAYRHLTETPAAEFWPAWSPDGKEIAFGRGPSKFSPGFQEAGTETGIFVKPFGDGPERKVADTGNMVGWMPDGKALLIRDRKKDEPFAIYQLDLATHERRRITEPMQGDGDWRFEASPDGKSLAFIRFARTTVGDLFVVPIAGGEPRKLTDWNQYITGVSWTPDGKEIVYSVDGRLWRISATLPAPGRGTPISGIPMPAAGLSISKPRPGTPARLAFHTSRNQISLRRIDLASAGTDGMISGIEPFAPSTRSDIPGRFSPDGSRAAFASNRSSENMELWIADSSGRDARQVTHLGVARRMLAGSWSPDGKQLLLDAEIQGHDELYVVSADGGDPVKLSSGPAFDGLAEWSKDSHWIYYASPGSGTVTNIWRIPAQGGTAEPVTHDGGFEPQISADGLDLYYVDRPPAAGKARVMKVSVNGGKAEAVIDDVTPFLWSVADAGIYFLRAEDQNHAIYFHGFAKRKTERVGALPFRVARLQSPGRFAVSHDGRWALVNIPETGGGDLMLIDDFR